MNPRQRLDEIVARVKGAAIDGDMMSILIVLKDQWPIAELKLRGALLDYKFDTEFLLAYAQSLEAEVTAMRETFECKCPTFSECAAAGESWRCSACLIKEENDSLDRADKIAKEREDL